MVRVRGRGKGRVGAGVGFGFGSANLRPLLAYLALNGHAAARGQAALDEGLQGLAEVVGAPLEHLARWQGDGREMVGDGREMVGRWWGDGREMVGRWQGDGGGG